MSFLYNLAIKLYAGGINIAAALGGDKAGKWVNGRKNWAENLSDALSKFDRSENIIWFHCASLGEFEQGRPLIEAFRKKYRDWKIVLTFYSPSGFEVRKNYKGADVILYLPADTPKNARDFISIVNPKIAVFVKYEFWFNYLNRLKDKDVPVVVISSIFRENQHFFKAWGKWFRKQLKGISHFYVQDQASEKLLRNIGIEVVTVSGDTRFDRVAEIAGNTKKFRIVEAFAQSSNILLAGSTWPVDEDLIIEYIRSKPENLKFIIAPHETNESHIQKLEEKLQGLDSVRFSEVNPDELDSKQVLIIDGIGYLSHLYQYARLAYIGGAFGVGLHNILEAATFGIPVIFGPNYGKFNEAVELVDKGGAFSITSFETFENITNTLLKDKARYNEAAKVCKTYIKQNTGASRIILSGLENLLEY